LIYLIASRQGHLTHQIKQRNEWKLEDEEEKIINLNKNIIFFFFFNKKSMKSASKQATILLYNTLVND